MGLEHTKSVFRMFKKVSDGAHGNTRGIHGSLTPCSLHKVLSSVDVYGRNFLDLGSGTGVVLATALTCGTSKVHGKDPAKEKQPGFSFVIKVMWRDCASFLSFFLIFESYFR